VNATKSERISGFAKRKPAMLIPARNRAKSAARRRLLIRPFEVLTGRLLPMAAIPDPEIVNPGTVGSIVVFLLFVAVGLVIRSGYKRIQKLDPNRENDK